MIHHASLIAASLTGPSRFKLMCELDSREDDRVYLLSFMALIFPHLSFIASFVSVLNASRLAVNGIILTKKGKMTKESFFISYKHPLCASA